MTIDQSIATLDSICSRFEDVLAELQHTAQKPQGPYAKVREKHPNAGKAWSAADDEELRRLFASGNTIDDLSLLFARTPNGVKLRLERLGLITAQAA